jgi:hypothetical protein
MAVAHFSLDLRSWDQSGDGVDHYDVNGAAAHQHLTDLKGLFTGIRLGY